MEPQAAVPVTDAGSQPQNEEDGRGNGREEAERRLREGGVVLSYLDDGNKAAEHECDEEGERKGNKQEGIDAPSE